MPEILHLSVLGFTGAGFRGFVSSSCISWSPHMPPQGTVARTLHYHLWGPPELCGLETVYCGRLPADTILCLSSFLQRMPGASGAMLMCFRVTCQGV